MPLAAAQFAYLGDLSDAELRQNHVQVHISDGTMPCRVSLQDAEQGAKVLLLNYEHQPAQSPYRSSHAIFVKENAVEADVAQGAVPDMLAKRLLSIRAFNSAHEIIDAEVCDGKTIEQHILRFFGDVRTDYIHLHFARHGCFAAKVVRV